MAFATRDRQGSDIFQSMAADRCWALYVTLLVTFTYAIPGGRVSTRKALVLCPILQSKATTLGRHPHIG